MLGKLYIPKEANADALRGVYERITVAIEKKVAVDAVSRNLLNRLEITLGKIVSELGDEAEDEGREGGVGDAEEAEEMDEDEDEDEEVEVKSENGDEEDVALEDIEEMEDEDEE